MERTEGKKKNYRFIDYRFSETTVRYVVMEESGAAFMQLLPQGTEEAVNDRYETVHAPGDYPDHRDWFPGSLVHLHLAHHVNSSYGNSYKFSRSVKNLFFSGQVVTEKEDCITIETLLTAAEGYRVRHILRCYGEENGFEVQSVFENNTGRRVRLELLTSASLDNLSPYGEDDGSRSLVWHTFRGGWSVEGKHVEQTLPQMNMEKSWGGSFESELIGSIGTKTVGRYFPYTAVEDREHGICWGMKLRHNATWQAELTRYGVKLSLSCGIGDASFGSWYKDIPSGESFASPIAYLAAVKGDIADLSHAILSLQNREIEAYGEEEPMAVSFNEWCTSWGNPTHDGMLELADTLSGSRVRYLVIDAGWFDGVVGDWVVDKKRFPHGMKAYTDEIRRRGFIPGIWMEWECIQEGARLFAPEYDDMMLQKNGEPLCGSINNVCPERYLDMRKPEVWNYAAEAIIGFLKENGFGYLKVDYNSNAGIGCDGADSPGEGIRRQMEAVYRFYQKIKEEIPDIVIENCASGGSRMEPMMTGVTAVTSFSDAHESFEIPVVAANLHYLLPPRQSLVWSVLRPEFDEKHMRYLISSVFLGRVCWSGDFAKLSPEQMEPVRRAEELYDEVSDIIKDGKSRIYRTDEINCRCLTGTQAVLRVSAEGDRALLVYHAFEEPKELTIPIPKGMKVVKSLYGTDEVMTEGDTLTLTARTAATGNVLVLENAE